VTIRKGHQSYVNRSSGFKAASGGVGSRPSQLVKPAVEQPSKAV
jgi:hypothetical protein